MDTKNTTVSLIYSGPYVSNGTMPIEDIAVALEGLSSAYRKIGDFKELDNLPELRLIAIEEGSFKLIIGSSIDSSWEWIGKNSPQIQAVAGSLQAIGVIVPLLIGVIAVTKHVQDQPYTIKSQINNVSIINSENVTLDIPTDTYVLYKNKVIAHDLSKIVKPLEENKVDSAEIKADYDSSTASATINIEEKPYFEYNPTVIKKVEDIWLAGRFNSLTKSTNKGIFVLNDGTRVSYQFINTKPEDMYQDFVYNGPVEVKCNALLDENLKPISISITEVRKLQQEIFPEKK